MLVTAAQTAAMLGMQLTDVGFAQIAALLPAADQAVKTYLQRDIEYQTYTEYLTGNNQQRITLRQTPVAAITNLWVNDSGYFGMNTDSPFDETTLLTQGQHYVLDIDQSDGSSLSGIIFRIGAIWPIIARLVATNLLSPFQGPCLGNIKVEYSAGYQTIPADLQFAVALTANFMKRTINYGGLMLENERLGDYAYSLLVNPLYMQQAGSILQILGRYKEVGW